MKSNHEIGEGLTGYLVMAHAHWELVQIVKNGLVVGSRIEGSLS